MKGRIIVPTIVAEAIPTVFIMINMHTRRLQESHRNTNHYSSRGLTDFSVFLVLLLVAISNSESGFAFLFYHLQRDVLQRCKLQVSYGFTWSSPGEVLILSQFQSGVSCRLFARRMLGLLQVQLKFECQELLNTLII